jgi:hypothetical protein
MKIIAGDWDGTAVHISEDGNPDHVYKLRDQFELLKALDDRSDGPFVAVLEAPFEAYNRARHQQTLDAFEHSVHELRTISPRSTSNYRIEHKWDGEKWIDYRWEKPETPPKTDAIDAAAIWQIATRRGVENLHIPAPQLADDDPWAKLRADAELELMKLRRTGRKTLLYKELRNHLPRFRDLPDERQRALGGTAGYSTALLPAVYVAARFTSDQREWERLMGLYESGKPSQFRSDVFHHGWGGNKKVSRRRDSGLTLSQFRRNLRWLYRQVKDLEIEVPEAA